MVHYLQITFLIISRFDMPFVYGLLTILGCIRSWQWLTSVTRTGTLMVLVNARCTNISVVKLDKNFPVLIFGDHQGAKHTKIDCFIDRFIKDGIGFHTAPFMKPSKYGGARFAAKAMGLLSQTAFFSHCMRIGFRPVMSRPHFDGCILMVRYMILTLLLGLVLI